MRVVLDTNTVVSGFLWDSPPPALIDAAIDERIQLFTCAALIEELAEIRRARSLPSAWPGNNSRILHRDAREYRKILCEIAHDGYDIFGTGRCCVTF